MEEFEKIDWQTKIDDIVDERFVSETRMRDESSMYKILNGTLLDPFYDLRTTTNGNANAIDKKEKAPRKNQNKNKAKSKRKKANASNASNK